MAITITGQAQAKTVHSPQVTRKVVCTHTGHVIVVVIVIVDVVFGQKKAATHATQSGQDGHIAHTTTCIDWKQVKVQRSACG
jgi:hypothetical protein